MRGMEKHFLARVNVPRSVYKVMMLCWIWVHSWHRLQTTHTHTHPLVCTVRTAQTSTCCPDLPWDWGMVALPSPCYKLQRLAGCACWVTDKTMSEVCRRLLSTAQRGCYDCGEPDRVPFNIQAGLFDSSEVQGGSELSHMLATCSGVSVLSSSLFGCLLVGAEAAAICPQGHIKHS